MLEYPEIFFRIIFSTFVGGLVGFERERSHKSAGLRTNAMVAMGATLITIISITAFQDNPMSDPTRLISNIIVGIGFIGGGAILHEGHKIHGLTTAATLWVVAAIGIVIGVGYYKEAIFATGTVYFILTILWIVERKNGERLLYRSLRRKEPAEEEVKK
ncbi:MAG: MgtC/SapB family protein [bacterium]|nr:MgtC/SapB family protein [bacterium]